MIRDFLFLAFAAFIIVVIVAAKGWETTNLIGWISQKTGVVELSYFVKLGYFILMGILTFLAILAIAPRVKSSPKKAAMKIVVVLLILIAAEEILQIFIPSRRFSIGDFICDLGGVLTAA